MPADPGGEDAHPTWVIAPANVPLKPGEGALSLAALQVRVDPAAEWMQMYHEVWRIERSYFYDPKFHGASTVADERRYEPYVASIASRADLNYVFQDMLGEFSVGHLRGNGGAIPRARRVPGGLLGADYAIRDNRYCLTKIYTGGEFNPHEKPPLAQPGLNLKPGDCILAINGQEVTGSTISSSPSKAAPARHRSARCRADDGKVRDVTVVPVASEANHATSTGSKPAGTGSSSCRAGRAVYHEYRRGGFQFQSLLLPDPEAGRDHR